MPSTIDELKASLNKKFGEGAIRRFGEGGMRVPTLSTGIAALDVALGVGGLPTGRIVELFGPEMSGKSTLAMYAVAEAQRQGLICAYVDAENALDPKLAAAYGVNVDDLLLSQPDNGQQGLTIVVDLVKSNSVAIIVVDSVAALTPREEIEGDMDDLQVGAQARMMAKGLRKINAEINRSDAIVIFINQLREKIGQMYGNPETQPGGRSLKFYSSVRIDVRGATSSTQIKNGTEVVGHRMTVKIVKNKVASPFTRCELNLMYGVGIDTASSLVTAAKKLGLVELKGSWLSWNEDKFQGDKGLATALQENDELYRLLDKQVHDQILAETDPDRVEETEEKPDDVAALEDAGPVVDESTEEPPAPAVKAPPPVVINTPPVVPVVVNDAPVVPVGPDAPVLATATNGSAEAPTKSAPVATLTERIRGFADNHGGSFTGAEVVQAVGGNPGAVSTILRNMAEAGSLSLVPDTDPKQYKVAAAS